MSMTWTCWQEKWAGRNFMEFNKSKWRVLFLGQNNYMQLQGGNLEWLESRFAEKALEVLAHKLIISRQCGLCWLYTRWY